MPVSPTHSAHTSTAPAWEACIALVDARYLNWLHGAGDDDADADGDTEAPGAAGEGRAGAGGEPAGALRERLPEVLGAALRASRVHARITRLVWYTSHAGAASLNGQLVRRVPAEADDGGVGLVLAMARDAWQLAEQRACAHLLVASDDDRLLATVDAVQARGVRVHLLADEAAADLRALDKTDAAWASLLRQADTRLIVQDLARPPMRAPRRERERERGEPGGYGAPGGYGGGGSTGPGGPAAGGSGDLQAIPPLVQAWLASLSEATRLMLQGQLPEQRGLPQEADRELLQQISHRLGRPLSVPERKLMRELARQALAFQGLPVDEEDER